jgi:hypothetical protein
MLDKLKDLFPNRDPLKMAQAGLAKILEARVIPAEEKAIVIRAHGGLWPISIRNLILGRVDCPPLNYFHLLQNWLIGNVQNVIVKLQVQNSNDYTQVEVTTLHREIHDHPFEIISRKVHWDEAWYTGVPSQVFHDWLMQTKAATGRRAAVLEHGTHVFGEVLRALGGVAGRDFKAVATFVDIPLYAGDTSTIRLILKVNKDYFMVSRVQECFRAPAVMPRHLREKMEAA